ncbi:hypothetical protein ACFX13_032197 [Malus domestica]
MEGCRVGKKNGVLIVQMGINERMERVESLTEMESGLRVFIELLGMEDIWVVTNLELTKSLMLSSKEEDHSCPRPNLSLCFFTTSSCWNQDHAHL